MLTTARRTAAALALTAPLLLAGCTGSDDGPSDERSERSAADDTVCEASMRGLQAFVSLETDVYEGRLADTLSDCSTADEWMDAARRFPNAVGYASGDDVTALPLELSCRKQENSGQPVCIDGFETGMLDGRP